MNPQKRAAPSHRRASTRQKAQVHARQATHARTSAATSAPASGKGEMLLTRRHFLYGAIGVGVLAAAGVGIGAGTGAFSKKDEPAFNVLAVPKSAVTSASAATPGDFTEIEDSSTVMGLSGSYELPYGTLVWASDSTYAACLVPTEGSKPLTKVTLLTLSNGTKTTAVSQAVGQDEGFEIYDVRACEKGLVWTEANILDGTWRIYSAALSNGEAGTPSLAEEGSSDFETPTLAAAGSYAFWQVLPNKNGSKSSQPSRLARVRFGADDAEDVYTSNGRMCTQPYSAGDSVVITPRTASSGTRYAIVRIDAQTGDVVDSIVLPSSMKPLEAGCGDTGLLFSFEAIYNYGDGIANLGTYIPASETEPVANDLGNSGYSNVPWFRHAVTPTAPPAWCGKWIIVKDSYNVCGFDPSSKQYFMLEVKSGAPSFGDYLASTGSVDRLVTYSNINYTSIAGDTQQYCNVRVWQPVK